MSATVKHLIITQPSVTRGMKKLEQELGVTLFDRKVNRISLNETGKLAAAEAKFLYQDDLNSLDELTQYSNFPVFRSNLSLNNHLEEQRSAVQPFLKEIAKSWPHE